MVNKTAGNGRQKPARGSATERMTGLTRTWNELIEYGALARGAELRTSQEG